MIFLIITVLVWYTEKDGGVKWGFEKDSVIGKRHDVIYVELYARWTEISSVEKVTVTFNVNGGSGVDAQEIEQGAIVIKPNDPIKEGYIFDG